MKHDQLNGRWIEAKQDDAEFQRLLAREGFIEDFLHKVVQAMDDQQVTRTELARRMGCRPANITQLMRRTRNLTAATMVDIAFHLGLRLRLEISPRPVLDHA